MIQAALVGCAHIHTPGFVRMLKERDDIQVTAVWDHDAARAAKNAEALDSTVVDDLDTIWSDEAIKAVIICSETDRHDTLVAAASAAGKHQFVEKPLGFGAADSGQMAAALTEAGIYFQTGYFMRGFPDFRFAKTAIANGWLGKVTRIRLSNTHAGSLEDWFTPEWLWMTDVAQAGVGAFGDLGTHILDILLWLTEAKVTGAACTTQTVLARYGDACDEYGEALLRFDDGMIATLAAGWVDVADPIKLEIAGTEGHIHVVDGQLYFKSKHVEGADGKTPWTELPERLPHAFILFLDAVTGKAAPAGLNQIPLVTPAEAARRSAIMAALYEAAEQEKWVQINE